MKFTVRKCDETDLFALREIACNTYKDTFEQLNTPENMKKYLNETFDTEKLRGELLSSGSFFYFIMTDDKLAGYLKCNEYSAQTDVNDPASLEIQRIYVIKEFQGKGLGNILLNTAADIAESKQKSYIWLGVWEKNEKALQFYKKNGFYIIGKHSFFMGDDEQTDYLMRRDIN